MNSSIVSNSIPDESLKTDPMIKDKPKLISPDNEGNLIFNCPHCDMGVIVHIKEINCGIFRHAALPNGSAVNPHLSEIECIKLRELPNIQGCVKPFQISSDYHINKCEYI